MVSTNITLFQQYNNQERKESGRAKKLQSFYKEGTPKFDVPFTERIFQR